MKNKTNEPVLIRSLAVLSVVLAGCMAFFDVVGICQKIDLLQESSCIFTALGIFSTLPRWFVLACLSGTLLVVCGFELYRRKTQKKQYGMRILCFFLVFWFNLLCYTDSVFFLLLTLVVAGFFALAHIPPAVRIAVTRHLAAQNGNHGDPAARCRQKLRQMEWVRLFPVKRFLAGCLWLADLALALLGMIACYRQPAADSLAVVALLLAGAALTAGKVWRYVTLSCHCVPVLNQIFSRHELEPLLVGESFTEFPWEDDDLQKHMPLLVSEHWLFIEGLLISRQLLLGRTILRSTVTSGGIYRRDSRLVFYYLDGSKVQTYKTNLYLSPEKSQVVKKALDQLAGVSIPLSCTPASIAEKYHRFLPEFQDSKEKLYYLLTHDISDRKQEFAAALSPSPKPQKKKRSQKAADRKAR